MECLVCLESITSHAIGCGDWLCRSVVCGPCFAHYLEIQAQEQTLPRCLAQHCRAYYLYSDIPVPYRERYVQVCLPPLLKEESPDVQIQIQNQQILERLRQERKIFLRDHFPKAIAIVAEVVCGHRLRHLQKEKKESETIKNKYGRLCMNMFCNGFLNDQGICSLCESRFCPNCEQLMEGTHQCREEDLLSISLSHSLPQCPTCGLYVDKDNGCNQVMCGRCGTKFIYGSRELGGSGGHTQAVPVPERVKLSVAYRDQISSEIAQTLHLIETKEPKQPQPTAIRRIIKDMLLHPNINRNVELVKAMDEFYRVKYFYKRYQRLLVEIEKLLQRKECTAEFLAQIYAQL